MKDEPREIEESSPEPSDRLRISRVLLWLLTVSAVVALTIAVALHWRGPALTAPDPYATLPFRPKVTYYGSQLTVINTEKESYLDTQLTLFVGWTTCRVSVGTIPPGREVSIPLSAFTYEDGKPFDAANTKAKLLEVRAHMNGYEVHRDLPPPQQ